MLSTQQALDYHLRRKVRCNSIVCETCDQTFPTKHALQMHELHCRVVHANPCREIPDFKTLKALYMWLPFAALVVSNDSVRYRNEAAAHIPIDTPVETLDPLDWAVVHDGTQSFWFCIDSPKWPGNSTTSSPLTLS